jgi:hypothetical protein
MSTVADIFVLPNWICVLPNWNCDALKRSRSSPAECFVVLLGWLGATQSAFVWETTSDAERKAMYDILDACLAWMTLPQSEYELQDLSRLAYTCDGAKRRHHAHQAGSTLYRAAGFEAMRLGLFSDLLYVIAAPWKNHLSPPNANGHIVCRLMHAFNNKYWPRSAQSLLPHGGKETLNALVQLFRPEISLLSQTRLYAPLHIIFAYCHPIVYSFFVTSPIFAEKVIALSFHRANSQLDKALSRTAVRDKYFYGAILHVMSATVRLLMSLVKMDFTDTQRQVFHRKDAPPSRRKIQCGMACCQ